MKISWYGLSCVQIKARKGRKLNSIAFNPFSKKEAGIECPKIDTDILALSSSRSFFKKGMKNVKGKPFVIDEPGEYEKKDILVQGIVSKGELPGDKSPKANIIYKVRAEKITIAFLGNLNQKELESEQLDRLGEIDILMIPVGEGFTLDAKKAAEIVSQVEPKMVIPINYKTKGVKLGLKSEKKFLKKIGDKDAETEEVLKVKPRNFAQVADETETVLLKPQK